MFSDLWKHDSEAFISVLLATFYYSLFYQFYFMSL